MMSKRNIVIMVVVILVVVAAFWVNKTKRETGYSVVYLTTGEVYIGKLTTFPELKLTDSYILQVSKDAADPEKNNFQLTPVSEALWAPKSIRFVKDNVVFYGRLMSDSKIAQTIGAQGK